MRTLDEEIAHQREVAENIRTEHNCECDYYDIGIDCVKCAEEHEQLAEWLEELKEYKRDSVTKESFERMKSKAYEKGCRQGYRKAIDDFVDRLSEYLDVKNATKYGNENAEQQRNSYDTLMKYEIADAIDDIAEQLKAGGESGKLSV